MMLMQRLKRRNFQNPQKRRSNNKEASINIGLAATRRSYFGVCLFIFFILNRQHWVRGVLTLP
jgi:hypothetical protein